MSYTTRDYHPLKVPGFIPYSTRDTAEGLGDFFRLQTGARVVNPHPVAEHMAAEGVGLDRLARHWLAAHMDADYVRAAPKSEIITRALGTSDFVTALTSGWHEVVRSTFDEAISGYRAILRDWPVRDFKPQYIPSFNGISDLKALSEHSEYQFGAFNASSVLEDVQVTTRGLAFIVSREALVNDLSQEIAAMMMQLGNIAALSLAQAVAAALQGTDTLDDGAAFFAEAKSNYITTAAGGAAPSVTTLDLAGAKLWRMPLGDHVAGLAPRFLVCPPEIAHTSRALVAAVWDPQGSAGTVPDGRVDVITLPHLTDTSDWYLMADPARAPTLALLRLAGSSSLVNLEQAPRPQNRDGLAFKLSTDFAVARVARHAVKVQSA